MSLDPGLRTGQVRWSQRRGGGEGIGGIQLAVYIRTWIAQLACLWETSEGLHFMIWTSPDPLAQHQGGTVTDAGVPRTNMGRTTLPTAHTKLYPPAGWAGYNSTLYSYLEKMQLIYDSRPEADQ